MGVTIPLLELPQWYSSMCSTIILALFAKKAYDSTDVSFGKFSKKSKYESESETEQKNISASIAKISTVAKDVAQATNQIPSDIPAANEDSGMDSDNVIEDMQREEQIGNDKPNYNDPKYINTRFDQLLEECDVQLKGGHKKA